MSEQAVISGEALAEALTYASVGIAMLNPQDLKVKMATPFYLRMAGCADVDVVGRPLFDVVPEVNRLLEPRLAEVLKTLAPGYVESVKLRLPADGGTETAYFNFLLQPVFNGDGRTEGIMVVANEVTDLVLEKQRLEENGERYRQIVSQCPIAMTVLRGTDLVIEVANPAILNHFRNRELSEVKGSRFFDAFPALRDERLAETFRQIFLTGHPYSEKGRLVQLHGAASSYVDLECAPLKNPDGSVYGILVTIYDVSEKVKIAKKTEENEERLRMVIEASGLGTWELDLKSKEFTYSDNYLAMFGITEHLSHEELLRFMHPDDLPGRANAFRRAYETGWLHYVSRLIWRDKSVHWIEAHGKVTYDESGAPLKMIGTSRDVTDEMVYQQSIKESEVKFRLLADSMPQLIWMSDSAGNLTYFNKAVFDYSGQEMDQLQGLGWIEIVHPEDRSANIRIWREVVRNGDDFHFEHRFRRFDGQYRWHLSRAIAQHDSQGRIQMWVGSSTDIHDQKTFAKELEEKVLERTRELKETNDVLEKANRDLEQFAYIASHDLQEPLRKIMTFSDILKKNMHDEALVKKYFSKIDLSAQRMADLIKSVLEYSRLPAHPGKLILTDLNEIVENVKTDFELTIADKSAFIETDDLPAVPGVPLQLHQLFSNLIGNALKFCAHKPYVRISFNAVPGHFLVDQFPADEMKQYAELRITDNGIGFDNRYKQQIFTIFQRLHGWQQYSGTGIGLALCKKIVDLHQGHIRAESAPGKGSTFFVYLPS